jgi:hypothetical protein
MMFFDNYIDVINGKSDLAVQLPEVRRVLQVIELARKSAETGTAIRFEN